MSLELHPNDVAQAEALWRSWKSGTDVELEATFPALDLTRWMFVLQHLRSLGLREEPQPLKLNIMVAGGLRFTLVGEGVIQEFCKDNTLIGKPFHVVLKEKKRTADVVTGQSVTETDWKDYGVRVKLRRELPLAMDDVRVRDVLSRWPTIPKSFRYMKRFSFESQQLQGIQFDLSLVRESKRGPRGEYIPATSFVTAEIAKQPMHYEVEVEAKDTSAPLKALITGIATVLRGMQRSYILVRESTRLKVLDYISTQTGAGSGIFPGPQPATLERVNILAGPTEEGVPNLRTADYNVTDKADGLRCLLVVMKNGQVFLVDTNMSVYGTDLRIADQAWRGVILDGEWITQDANKKPVNRYYAFDIYNGRGGADVTGRPFLIRGNAAGGPEGGATMPSRFAEMTDCVGAIAAAPRVAGVPPQNVLHVAMKTFRTAITPEDPLGIFKEAAETLDRLRADTPYHIDGLIFTPNAAPLPKMAGTWPAQLKWKPASENTIDFMAVFERDRDTGEELVSTKLREDTNQIVRYKTLRLFVGSNTDPALADPRDTILSQKPLPASLEKGEFKPVEFTVQPADPMASVCYLALNAGATDPAGAAEAATAMAAEEDVLRCTQTGDPIQSRSIVEMAYHPEAPPGWRWEPLRVRWDKTERFQRGIMGRTMNADWVANSIWSSIHAPVTEHMIRTGALEEGVGDTDTTQGAQDVTAARYYVRKAPARDLHRVRGLREFHNRYIKEDILLNRVLTPGVALYDMTCGMAGDIHKWIKGKVGWVLGTDIAEKNLTDPRDGAYRRYLNQIVRTNGQIPPMLFVQANAAQRLADGGAGQTQMDRAMLRVLWGGEEPTAPAYAQSFKGKAADGFDVVSCMFSLHYFFKDRATVDGWLRNVADTLRVGGYFVGCCFDGDAVAELLADVPVDGMKQGVEGGADIWSITRRYGEGGLPATDEGLGKAVDVNFISIGETYTEYLVSWTYLQRRMEGIGCELLNAEELATLGLQNSTNMFETSYNMAAAVGRQFPMSATLRRFSFLNRWFIFKRRSAGAEIPQAMPGVAAAETNVEREVAVGPVGPNGVAPASEVLVREDLLPEVDIPLDTEQAKMDFYLEPEEPTEEPEEPAEEPEEPAEEPTMEKATGKIHIFYHKSPLKDDLGIKEKAWKRILSTYYKHPLKDRSDPSVVYPSLEAAITAAKFQIASNKPELGANLFGQLGSLHQKYALQRMEKGSTITEKESYALMEDEGDEIRKAGKASEMKKAGAKFNEAAWIAGRQAVIEDYVRQRYETDALFRRVMDALKVAKAHLVYKAPAAVAEYGGEINEDDEIEGDNLIGRAYMKVLGLYY